jgi:Flp pilus assembly protein TadD
MIFSRTDRVQIEQDNFCPLGLTLCRDGQIERDADELHKALELNPEESDAAKALEMIRAR